MIYAKFWLPIWMTWLNLQGQFFFSACKIKKENSVVWIWNQKKKNKSLTNLEFIMNEDSACITQFKKLLTKKYNSLGLFCRNNRFAKHRNFLLMLEKTLFWLSVNLQKGPKMLWLGLVGNNYVVDSFWCIYWNARKPYACIETVFGFF